LKLLFDQNLSRKLVTRLTDIFPSSSHVQFHALTEAGDSEIWELAKTQDFCIVTQDADFAERIRLYDSHPKVIWLRCGNAPTSRVKAIFRSGVETIQEFMSNDLLDCLELY
jgi:predicted nuclease of predicted toxin-antitoxin system